MRRFDRRRALITGGAHGIGAAIAQRLADEGAHVLVGDLDLAAAQQLANAIDGTALLLDVAADDVQARIAAHDPVDVLVNNAGIDDFGWLTDTTPDRWRRLIAVNLLGTIACCHATLPAMQHARYGRIVNITSEAGRIGAGGNAVYGATKGALIALTKSLARENARYNITVNAIAPGPVQTPMLDANRALPHGEKIIAAMIHGTQLHRLGHPTEIAAAVAFLAAEEASYITGETLGVSGGMGLGA
jgi:2-hydroxycyclohexanecarboxyl-CoA dehydrogenase